MIASRLEEFWALSTRWHRSLWNLGATAAIGELLEASESLPSPALKALQAEVEKLVGPDPAVGDAATRRALVKLLRANLVFQYTEWHELSQLLTLVETDYLKRWSGSSARTVRRTIRCSA